MSLTSKESKAAVSAKEEKEALLDDNVKWKPKSPLKEAAHLSSMAGSFLEQFGEDISHGLADDRTVAPALPSRLAGVHNEKDNDSSFSQPPAGSTSSDTVQESSTSGASDPDSRKRPHSPATVSPIDQSEGTGKYQQQLSQSQQHVEPKPVIKSFHSYTGATFGIQQSKKSSTEVPLYTPPLNSWYLSLGIPNFSRSHRSPQAAAAPKRQRIASSEMEKKFEDDWWKPYLEKADQIAVAAPAATQQSAEPQQVPEVEHAQANGDRNILAALRQEKDADKQLQEKILDAIFYTP